ncbi:hypothetical protein NQ176_g317 [Zarea fungicola]|uniref:Uncharacterized protein n=1 Tax=Zarea fungicola TaxID=93591 RepID=A0ACC1NYI0_9HYPO|nr:hypothetical protein NQ176_g317 [Lecanicillium fungicola]
MANDQYTAVDRLHKQKEGSASFLDVLDVLNVNLDSSNELVGYDTPTLTDFSSTCDIWPSDSHNLSSKVSQPSITSYHHNENTVQLPPGLDLDGPAAWGHTNTPHITFETLSSLEPPSNRSRAKFTQEEDQIIIHLRNNGQSWKEIAEKLPGRSPGALQVRYSTKLKRKSLDWTTHLDQQIVKALLEYEQQRWTFVASQIGCGISAEACRERAVSQLKLL